MNANSSETVGEVVRYHRRRAGLSQHGLAELAGVGKTSVFDVEKGKRTTRLATLMAVFRVLNIDVQLDGPLMAECRMALEQKSSADRGAV
ncbi:MAG: helix-turn-helix transcriptional regulator [Gammaproteobacteria bacterium]|nr:helix-turn-helix transcriptional regulator [Gammaproteobacteria bacterium]